MYIIDFATPRPTRVYVYMLNFRLFLFPVRIFDLTTVGAGARQSESLPPKHHACEASKPIKNSSHIHLIEYIIREMLKLFTAQIANFCAS